MTKVVGLTGNIGSGKSTISQIFSALNIPIFYADDEAKKILNSNRVTSELIKTFGTEILNHEKKIDKQKLANIIFNDSSQLQKINNIIHPLVYEHFLNWLNNQHNVNYVILEAAILFESGFDKYVDFIINVHANKQLRIKRIFKRDGIKLNDVIKRMKNQLSDLEKKRLSGFTIDNNGKKLVIPQVLQIHESILKK